MKRYSFLGIVVTGLCFLIAVYFYGKPKIVPNDAVLGGDTLVIERVATFEGYMIGRNVYAHLNFLDDFMEEYNFREYAELSDTTYLILVEFSGIRAMTMDTLKAITIYDPQITVVWDTLK